MSYESELTTMWQGGSAMDDWYGAAMALKEEAKAARASSKLRYATDEEIHRDSIALPSNAFYNENNDNGPLTDDEDLTARNKRELRASIDKKLPALPKIDDPYFEYMFSDADNDQENDDSDDGMIADLDYESRNIVVERSMPSPYSTVYDDDVPSPVFSAFSDDMPSTPANYVLDPVLFCYDGTPVKQETPTISTLAVVDCAASLSLSFVPVYSIAKSINSASPPVSFAAIYLIANNIAAVLPPVSFTPGHSAGNSINAAVTSSAPLFDDEETDVTDATAGFYGGFEVEESPSPYHAPITGEGAGFGDIRDGCEHMPQQWTHSETKSKVVAPYNLTGLQTFSENIELPAINPVKPILQPKSQIAKAAKTCDMGFGSTHRATYAPQFTALSGFSDEVIAKLNGTKRSAPVSILSTTIENYDDSDYDKDEDDELHATQSAKKARLSSATTMDAEVIYAPMPSTLSIHSTLKHKSSTRSITQSLLNEPVDFFSVTDGYPGQFQALLPPTKLFHPKFLSCGIPEIFTFGNENHANGLFTHTRFQPGGNTPFSKYSLDFTSSLGKALKIADANHDSAASTERTTAQEALRRETHFECAAARLEGVAVGEYRYYQGHNGVEEYSKGGMCVCWEECFCTIMCTKYADMLCPCAKNLEFEFK